MIKKNNGCKDFYFLKIKMKQNKNQSFESFDQPYIYVNSATYNKLISQGISIQGAKKNK